MTERDLARMERRIEALEAVARAEEAVEEALRTRKDIIGRNMISLGMRDAWDQARADWQAQAKKADAAYMAVIQARTEYGRMLDAMLEEQGDFALLEVVTDEADDEALVA